MPFEAVLIVETKLSGGKGLLAEDKFIRNYKGDLLEKNNTEIICNCIGALKRLNSLADTDITSTY